MNKFLLIFLILLFLPSVKAIPELPNQFYGTVIYLNELIPDGHKLTAQLGEEKFTVNIINGRYGIETPLLVSKDNSININKIDFYVDNKKILIQDYNSGGFTELHLNVPSDTVMINETTIKDLNLKIGNTNNLSEKFTAVQEIEFKENDKPLVKFDYDFNKNTIKDLLKNIVIKKQEGIATQGFIIIKGVELPFGKTKTVYVDNLNANVNSVCIKDAEISSISEISSKCNEANEKMLVCNGETIEGYSCTDLGAKYKITGLTHSGVKEQSPCQESWSCTTWSECSGGTQTRTCTDANTCGTSINKPSQSQSCDNDSSRRRSSSSSNSNPSEVIYQKKEVPKEETNEIKEETEKKKEEPIKLEIEQQKESNKVTGGVIGFAKKTTIYLGIGVIALAIIFGIWQSSNYIKR